MGTQVRQEIERRIAEKEEEFLSTKKNFQKAVDGMQGALETESKGKAEAIRMKKKLESDVSELETALEHANASNQDTQKTIKKLGNLKPNWKMSKGPRKLLETTFSPMNEGPILPKMLLKRPELFLNKLIGPEE